MGTLVTVVTFYENPTDVSGGTAMTEYNRDRNSPNTAGLAITHTPTVNNLGTTVIFQEKFGLAAGGGQAATKFGGDSRSETEFILKQNEQYVLRCSSLTDGNIISAVFEWYEHTNNT